MRILALDTTSPEGSIALLEDESIVLERTLAAPAGFGAILFEALEIALADSEWPLSSIRAFAAAAGPGSFTGVRVGLAAAKGLAEIGRSPVFAISTLHALAEGGTRSLRATVIDARRGAVYASLYDAQLQTILPEIVQPLETWIEEVPLGDLEFLTNDPMLLAAALEGTAHAQSPVIVNPALLAGSVGRIAASQARQGILPDAAEAVANYVRHADAQLFWKDK